MQARVPFDSAQWVVMSVDEQAWLQKQNLPTNCRCSLDSILTHKKKSIGTILCPFSSTLLSFLHFSLALKEMGSTVCAPVRRFSPLELLIFIWHFVVVIDMCLWIRPPRHCTPSLINREVFVCVCFPGYVLPRQISRKRCEFF